MSAILAQGLDISYGPTRVTFGIDLAIAEGESFALVGESGSGKSTVLKAIAGLAPDWRGRLEVSGIPRSHGVDRKVARLCQMVFQDPYGSLHPARRSTRRWPSRCASTGSRKMARGWKR